MVGGREVGSAGVKVINQGEVSSKLPTKPPPTETNFNNKKTKKKTKKKKTLKKQKDKHSKLREKFKYKSSIKPPTKPNKYHDQL